MRNAPTIALAALLAFPFTGMPACAVAHPSAEPATPPTTWTERAWSDDFTAESARPADSFFAGHGLDVAFDPTGAAWGIGEFAMQVTRAADGGATTLPLPLKSYGSWEWTKPFRAVASGQRSSSSDLGESVIHAAGAVWVAQGGGQQASTLEQPFTGNHSILTRISTTAPYTSCAIPIPGDNQHLIGLAYDSRRNRVWFATSEGPDGSKLGWVKAAGLGARCQNDLDYGGNPALTATENDALRAAAQLTIDSLRCTPDQSRYASCVHITAATMPTGAAHLAYDTSSDSLWLTNWGDRKLRQYRPGSAGQPGALVDHGAPTSPHPGWPGALPWQIAANATHVFLTEYAGNRLLAYDKRARTWSAIATPVEPLGVDLAASPAAVQTHSLTLAGDTLWLTVSDEDGDAATAVGRLSVSSWAAGAPQGVLYTGWGAGHSFRGVDVSRAGVVALADAPDHATVLLTPRQAGLVKCVRGIVACEGNR